VVSRIATISRRRAGLVLCLAALLVPLLAVNAARVLDELPGGGGDPGSGDAADAREALGDRLGWDPIPLAVLTVGGDEPASSATAAVALRALRSQAEAVEGVARAVEGSQSADGRTTAVSIHADPGLPADGAARTLEMLDGVLDPGILTMEVGGPRPTAEGVRAVARGEVGTLQLLVLPLIALILAGSLGVRMAAAALLGTALAVGLAILAIGIASALVPIHAAAAVAAAILALVLAIEATAGLLYRYREEAGTLGAGAEAVEYALRVTAPLTGLAALSAAAIGATMLAVPVPGVASVGAGLIAGAAGAPAALLVALCALVLVRDSEPATTLPLVAERTAGDGPLAFRWLLALRARRRSAAAATGALVLSAIAALPLLGAGAVGSSAADLPAGEQAREAGERLASAFGPGATAPVLVGAEVLLEPAIARERLDALAAMPAIESVGEPSGRGGIGLVEARPIAPGTSPAGQQAAEEVRRLEPAGEGALVTGEGALVLDGRGLLTGHMLALSAIGLLLVAAIWAASLRASRVGAMVLAALPAPLVGLGALAFVFEGGHLAGVLGYEPQGAPHLLSYVAVAAPLLAIGVARSGSMAWALREELALGGGVEGSTARAGTLTLLPAAVASGCAIAATGAWLGSGLVVANELAVGIAAGLAADVVLARGLLAPALARLLLPGRIASPRR
jgi:uncharacterized membrane protein YdfJ with MMPL/SSD domain